MDNFRFDINSMTESFLIETLRLFFKLSDFKRATHFAIRNDGNEFALFWHEPEKHLNANPLPYPMEGEALISFATNWLKTARYPAQPDHDGSNSRGWRVYNEAWGHIWDSHYGLIAIKATWAMHGK